jgi:hypothetical protein
MGSLLTGGNTLETVLENKTGIFFKEQTVESLIEAVKVFEKDEDRFDCNEIRKNAERFSKERFKREFREFVVSPNSQTSASPMRARMSLMSSKFLLSKSASRIISSAQLTSVDRSISLFTHQLQNSLCIYDADVLEKLCQQHIICL